MNDDWRTDPNWRLVYVDLTAFPDGPPEKPTKQAELAVPDTWASEYRDRAIVATWDRIDPRLSPPASPC